MVQGKEVSKYEKEKFCFSIHDSFVMPINLFW